MRKIMLGVAATALMATPGLANAATNAVVGLDYNSVDISGFPDNIDVYGLSGAFNHDFSNGWQVQMDGYTGRASEGGCCLNTDYAALHLGMRHDTYSLAGFVGLQTFAQASGLNAGVEGQMFFSQAMLEGSVSYVDFSDFDLNATNAQVDGSWFLTPNLSLNALVGYTNANEGSSNGDWWSYGVSGEYRFQNCPTSISLGYRRFDESGGNIDTWSIGVTFDLGTGSLQERNKSGPSWNGGRSVYDNLDRTIGLISFVSDRRLKRDITLLTTLENGMNIYSFRYLWSDEVYVGVMAQDLLAHREWRAAVIRQPTGFYAVNYARLGLQMATLEEWDRRGIAAVALPKNNHGTLRLAA